MADTSPTLSQAWADGYHGALLARLEWELDAGWRTVTNPTIPRVVHTPVYGSPVTIAALQRRRYLSSLSKRWVA